MCNRFVTGGFLCYLHQPKGMHQKLICYYDDRNRNPRLVLSPVKVEVLHVDPDLFMFRDLLTEGEMNRLKELASPKVQVMWWVEL